MANKLIPGTHEYLMWAIESDYTYEDEITDPQQANAEAQQRITQAIKLNATKVDLQHLDITHIPANICQLTQLEVLLVKRSFTCQKPFTLPTGEVLSKMTSLKVLKLSYCIINNTNFLLAMPELVYLDLSSNQITTIENLQAQTQLTELYLNYNQITTIENLQAQTQLTHLYLDDNQITTIENLQTLANLQQLNISNLNLESFTLSAINSNDFNWLNCEFTTIGNIPTPLLSQRWDDDCLPRIKDYFKALENGAIPINEVTLMVLGNGQIGKTQICRRLCGDRFDDGEPSTHGVLIKQAQLPVSSSTNNSALPITLNIWDFGGQELYHGTHRLFFNRQDTIFLTMWLPSAENENTHSVDGMTFKNHTLDYWLEHIRQCNNTQAGIGAKVIVAQAQCDKTPYQNVLPVAQDWAKSFEFARMTDTSAVDDDGLDRLIPLLQQAAKQTLNQSRQQLMPKAWQRVKNDIKQWLEDNNNKKDHEKTNRLITLAQFTELCQTHDDPNLTIPNNAIDTLLHFLYQTGVVYYRKGLFNDKILIDQTWCLDAIYGVFHRQTAYQQLKKRRGKFEADDMGYWLWNEQGHSEGDQALFIQMMESCGVCFRITDHYYWRHNQYQAVEYCVPELLPDKSDAVITGAIESNWLSISAPISELTFDANLLHQTLFNRIMAMIAKQANHGGYYWDNGLLVYASQYQCWLLFERQMQTQWQGQLCFKAKGQNAAGFLEHLVKWIEQEQQSWNVQLTVAKTAPDTGDKQPNQSDNNTVKAIAMEQSKPQICVSYRWQDESVAIADQFCQHATGKGIEVMRDTNELSLGDNIQEFMKRIGRGKRVIVVLSNSYLQSPNCMFELFEIWRNSKGEAPDFINRIKVFRMADLQIDRPTDRIKIAGYWKAEHQNLTALIDEHGMDVLGKEDFAEFKRIGQFYTQIGDMLKSISSTLYPQDINQLLDFGLEGLEGFDPEPE